jgi:hypothetical protein
MLLLLPVLAKKQQVVEIQVPSQAKKMQRTKLVEVCWTRLIPVTARVKMYLVGTRFFFEHPTPGQLPQAQ